MEYSISREKFLELKEHQKSLVNLRKEVKTNLADYSRACNKWWAKVPANKWGTVYEDWWKERPHFFNANPTREYARAFNILYSLLKGKTYEQIEKKAKDVDKPSYITNHLNCFFTRIIVDFKLDKEAMKPILALVPFAWK